METKFYALPVHSTPSNQVVVTNAETIAALRHVLAGMSDRIDEWLRDEIPGMPWAEAEAAERYLLACKKALHEIIAQMLELEP